MERDDYNSHNYSFKDCVVSHCVQCLSYFSLFFLFLLFLCFIFFVALVVQSLVSVIIQRSFNYRDRILLLQLWALHCFSCVLTYCRKCSVLWVLWLSDMEARDCSLFLSVDATNGISVSTQPVLSLLVFDSSGDRYVPLSYDFIYHAPCGLLGCKNRPAPFPVQMS